MSKDDFEDKNRRMFLKKKENHKLIKAVNELLDKRVKHQRIKKYGSYSKIITMMREEPIKLVQYLRERKRDTNKF